MDTQGAERHKDGAQTQATLVLVTSSEYPTACARALQASRYGVMCLVFCCPRLFELAQQKFAEANQ